MPLCGFTISARMMYVHAMAFITRKPSKICGSAAGISTVRDHLPLGRPQREGRLHQLLGHDANRVHHRRQQEHHRAQEEEGYLLRLVDAEPEDQQRNEGGDRQVPHRRDDGVEEAG